MKPRPYTYQLGEVVWYHLPKQPNRAVKARIASTSRIGRRGAERYSVERLDETGHGQIHNVKRIELSRPQGPAMAHPPREIKEPCHV